MNEISYGGNIVSVRNYNHIKSVVGDENVFIYTIKDQSNNVFQKIINYIYSFFSLTLYGATNKDLGNIYQMIKEEQIETVFLDSSLFGGLAKFLSKKTNVAIISFFHNVEFIFTYSALSTLNYFNYPRLISTYLSERLTVKHSNCLVSLNERDQKIIRRIYKCAPHYVIPVSLFDEGLYNIPAHAEDDNFNILFIGSYFYANTHGLKWFVKNVFKNVPGNLLIAGKNMNALKEYSIFECERIQIYDSPPSLKDYYANADIVILPIFKGSGMKVKTAEALMYGKIIVGTKEAFSGYNFDNADCVIECNSALEFIDAIQHLYNSNNRKWNQCSRDIFEEKYSWNCTLPIFRKLLSSF